MGKYEIDDRDHIGKMRNSMRLIYKYRDPETGIEAVLKRFPLKPRLDTLSVKDDEESEDAEEETGVPIMTIREISLLKMMPHPNIARLLEIQYNEGDNFVRLFIEYPDIDLEKFLKEDSKAKDQKLMKKLFCQLLRGIAFYHSIRAAHGDLNPKNVLIDVAKENLKILNIEMQISGSCKAPELLLGSTELSPAADMFAVGCIFAEMMTGKPLFAQEGPSNLTDVFNLLGTPDEETWPGVTQKYKQVSDYDKISPKNLYEVFSSLEPDGVDVLSKLLCLDPSGRITAAAALRHNYFKVAQLEGSSPAPFSAESSSAS